MSTYDDYRNSKTDSNSSSLISVFNAARSGDVEFFRLLLVDHPEILTLRDAIGYSAFMLACYHGHDELVRYFIAAGADVNDSDNGGNSVLMGAAFKGHTEIVQALLDAGADPDLQNQKGQTAFSFAQMFGRSETLAVLRVDGKANFREKLKAWFLFIKPKTKKSNTERIHHV